MDNVSLRTDKSQRFSRSNPDRVGVMMILQLEKQPSFPEEKEEPKGEPRAISSELHLISPHEPLDKDIVLKRIRRHKYMNKLKCAVTGRLMHGSTNIAASILEPKCWDLEDTFSSP
ncbi:hypothetical protein Ancab_026058 [Ancistrocladus abbreviatus]